MFSVTLDILPPTLPVLFTEPSLEPKSNWEFISFAAVDDALPPSIFITPVTPSAAFACNKLSGLFVPIPTLPPYVAVKTSPMPDE